MKKTFIILLVLLMVVVTGCQTTNKNIKLFVENKDKKLALFDSTGKALTKFIYDSYKEVGQNAYLVDTKDGQTVINKEGKELVKIGKYSKLESLYGLIIATKKDDKKIIFNSEFKEVIKEDKNTKIDVSDLIVVSKGKEQIVYNFSGEVLLSTKDEIETTSVLDENQILIGFKNKINIYNLLNNKKPIVVELKEAANFKLTAYNLNKGYLLVNQSNNEGMMVDLKGKIVFKLKDIQDLKFDKQDNIIGVNQNKKFVISDDGKEKNNIASFYLNSKTYINKNEEFAFGPHKFVSEKKDSKVDGLQVYPVATLSIDQIFPVYVKDKGFMFYNYQGKEAIKDVYDYVENFNDQKQTIVAKNDKYWIIDETGKKISKAYEKIVYLNDGYYQAFTNGFYEVVNNSGQVVISDVFLGDGQVVLYNNELYGIFVKNEESYIYKMSDNKLVFKASKVVIFNKDGYYVAKDNSIYYNMSGKEIYKR